MMILSLDCTEEYCNNHGTCDDLGFCQCEESFGGSRCQQCSSNHYGYPNCKCMYYIRNLCVAMVNSFCLVCLASETCSGHGSCNSQGNCNCKAGYKGENCDQCADNYFGYPNCVGNILLTTMIVSPLFEIGCSRSETCSNHGECNVHGNCVCEHGWAGPNCDRCAVGFAGENCTQCDDNYYQYPSCRCKNLVPLIILFPFTFSQFESLSLILYIRCFRLRGQ
jgi:laminin alpha 3/5